MNCSCAVTWWSWPSGGVSLWIVGCDWVRGSVEIGLNLPQFLLDPACLPLTGLLKAGITVGGQEVDVRGGKLGDAAPKVGLQPPVRAVVTYSLLEGVYLTHNFCYAPLQDSEMGRENKKKCESGSLWMLILNFSPSPPCLWPNSETVGLTLGLQEPAVPARSPDPNIWMQPVASQHLARKLFSNQIPSYRNHPVQCWHPISNSNSTAVPLPSNRHLLWPQHLVNHTSVQERNAEKCVLIARWPTLSQKDTWYVCGGRQLPLNDTNC